MVRDPLAEEEIMGEFVRLESDKASGVATIRIERPPMNAISKQLAAELSEVAITQLFEELGAAPTVAETEHGKVYAKDGLTVFVGDIFKLSAKDVGNISGVYDRAALVALPSQLRAQYASHLMEITHKAPQLIISFEYNQDELAGPPFSVNEHTVASLYADSYVINRLERSVLEGGLKGKVDAENLVFELVAK